jgi:hypothetical protein
MKDVVIRGVSYKWVDGNGFSQGGKIAHELKSPLPAKHGRAGTHRTIVA